MRFVPVGDLQNDLGAPGAGNLLHARNLDGGTNCSSGPVRRPLGVDKVPASRVSPPPRRTPDAFEALQRSPVRASRVARADGSVSIRKLPSGRWHARLKSGRQYVAGKTFDTRREAQAWLARERAAISGGIDPRAGRALVRNLLPTWLDEPKVTVTRARPTSPMRHSPGCCRRPLQPSRWAL